MGLPWRCPEHPDAQILHLWDNNFVWRDGYPRDGYSSNHRYECNECQRELAPPNHLTCDSALQEEQKMKVYICKICGKEFTSSDFDKDYGRRYRNTEICLGCCLEHDPDI